MFFDTFMTRQLKALLFYIYFTKSKGKKKSSKLKYGFIKLLIYWMCITLPAGNNFLEGYTNKERMGTFYIQA